MGIEETPEDRRQLAFLTSRGALPGSGRLRYGAAMHFHRRGLLSDAVLEVFRICALRDEDPHALLAQRGLAAELPAPRALSGDEAIARLIEEADQYLSALPGPGVAEVRAGIARWRDGPAKPAKGRPNAVIETWLPGALASLAETHTALAEAIAAAAPHLVWITYDGYPPDEIGAAFCGGHAYASIIGGEPNAILPAEDYDLGLFLIAPHVLYRDHKHKAPELYAPLTGPHGWRFGPETPMVVKKAHEPVWNTPYAPHMTKVGPLPFLCVFGWTRDVSEVATVIPADDWPALEDLRIEA